MFITIFENGKCLLLKVLDRGLLLSTGPESILVLQRLFFHWVIHGGLENVVFLCYLNRGHTIYDEFCVVGGIYLQYLLNGPEKAVFNDILSWS